MLPKENRLNLAQTKWRYSAADTSFSTPFFKLLIKRNESKISRFGFLVSGKIGKAAVRNRARRLLAEVVHGKKEVFPRGLDFIFIAHPVLAKKTYEEVRSSFDKILPKIPFPR